MVDFIRNNKFFLTYYLAIAVLTIAITKIDTEYSSIARFMYMCAVVVPALKNIQFLSLSIIIFWGFSNNSFTPMFPSTVILEIFAIAVILGFNNVRIKLYSLSFVLIILYFALSDLVTMPEQATIWPYVLVVFMISFYVQSKRDIDVMAFSFMIMSVMLSILFLINVEDFAVMYSKGDNIERSYWINPNQFGGNISCGVVAGFWLLFYREEKSLKHITIFIIICQCISLIVLFMNASRGSILAALSCFLCYLFKSNTKKQIKLLIIILFAGFMYYLFSNNYLELLMYRMGDSENNSTLGDRTYVWADKISYLFNQNIFIQLFGLGIDGCDNAAHFVKTHNDFVTSLVAHGFVGLLLFIYFITFPIQKAISNKRTQVIGLSFFLFVECCVLEPFFRGYLSFLMLYLFIFKLATLDNHTINE